MLNFFKCIINPKNDESGFFDEDGYQYVGKINRDNGINLFYNGKDLKIWLPTNDSDNLYVGSILLNEIFYIFKSGTPNYKNLIKTSKKILEGLEKFGKLSEDRKIMGGYYEDGELYIVRNIFHPLMPIDDFLNSYKDEIEDEIGNKFDEKSLKKWLIKNKRIFNEGNDKIIFTW